MLHPALALVSLALSTTLHSTPPTASALLNPSRATAPAPILTDDIVRRLRRMGFDGIKTYNTRPPERDGELC